MFPRSLTNKFYNYKKIAVIHITIDYTITRYIDAAFLTWQVPSMCGHDTLTLTSDNKVKETLFVVSTSLLSLQPLSVCHVGQHILHKEWLEACGGIRAVAGGRSVVEHRVNLVDSPWTTTNTPHCTGLKLSRILLPESSSTSTGKL